MGMSQTPIAVQSAKDCCIRAFYGNRQERAGYGWRRGTYGGGAAFYCDKWPVLAPGNKHNKVRYRIRKESSSGQDQ